MIDAPEIIDDLRHTSPMAVTGNGWALISDRVMGGVSAGTMRLAWVRSAVLRLPALGLQPSFAIGVGQSRAIPSRPFSCFRAPPRLRKLSVCGVGHIAALVARFIPCLPASCEGVGFVCRFSFALALGVGHSRSISVRFPPLERVPEQVRGVGHVVPLADGEDEQPLALVGRTDFRRRKEACRKAVAHADQSAGDFGEAEAEMMGDIFEEDEGVARTHR